MDKKYNSIRELLSKSQNIVITSHLNPDGDAVGSSLGLYHYLKKIGKNATVILPNRAPATIASINGYGDVLTYFDNTTECQTILKNCDIIFSLDYNDIATRIGEKMGTFILNECADKPTVLIDHHLAPDETKFTVSLSDSTSAATSLLIYRFIVELSGDEALDANISTALYVGLMTDTGNFSYGNLSGELYRAVASLVEHGVSPARVSIMISSNQAESRLRLIGYSIYDKMVVMPEIAAAYIALSKEELDKFNYQEGDIEGLVNMPLSIAGIVNTALFTEKSELVKISLRSQDKEGIDMNDFARTYYIGGGHRNAAGGKYYGSLGNAIDIFINGMREKLSSK